LDLVFVRFFLLVEPAFAGTVGLVLSECGVLLGGVASPPAGEFSFGADGWSSEGEGDEDCGSAGGVEV
jgi:hypothetical protein